MSSLTRQPAPEDRWSGCAMNPTTHELARALLRLPDVDIHATATSPDTPPLRSWAASQIVESRIRGTKPSETRFAVELIRVLGYYQISPETESAIVEDFADVLVEILGIEPRQRLPAARQPAQPPLPDTEATVLLDEVSGLAAEILDLKSPTEGLRRALAGRVQEIYQRSGLRAPVRHLMLGLTAHLKTLSKSAEQPAAPAEAPASSPTPPPPETGTAPEVLVPLPAGRSIPVSLGVQGTSLPMGPRPYVPNPLGPSTAPPATFQEACRAQLDYVTTGDPTDLVERRNRFLEEALELVQSVGLSQPEAVALVEYVFGREVGEPGQELGGTLCTLAHLASYAGLDSDREGRRELDRTWHPDVVAKIRGKRATRHGRGPLPGSI